MLAKLGHRTLIVDADPQCNLSALILGDNFDKYYLDDNTRENNIKDGVKPAFEAKVEPIKGIECPSPARNPNLYLLPGHADLSEYETALSFAQTTNNAIAALQNLPGAFNALIDRTATKVAAEFVLIDLNPGLSAINQNLFILSDGFLIPTNPDPFSIMAIDTLGKILPKWVDWAVRMRPLFEASSYPLPTETPKFVGEVIQRFNIRKGRAAKPYRDNIAEIKTRISEYFLPIIKKNHMTFSSQTYQKAGISDDFCLAEIPDFAGLLPKSGVAGVPVYDLTDAELTETGVVLDGLKERRNEFNRLFETLAKMILALKP